MKGETEIVMESSEEEDDFPSIESIIPQSKVDSLYQSHTEKVRSFPFPFHYFASYLTGSSPFQVHSYRLVVVSSRFIFNESFRVFMRFGPKGILFSSWLVTNISVFPLGKRKWVSLHFRNLFDRGENNYN